MVTHIREQGRFHRASDYSVKFLPIVSLSFAECVHIVYFEYTFLFPCYLDYNAPVSETGDLTEKYYALKKIIKEYAPKGAG